MIHSHSIWCKISKRQVMQIFICIVVGIPVMRTPLQILFLILVTDLPPSIALGMEPGEANILKMRPRPKESTKSLPKSLMSIGFHGKIKSKTLVEFEFGREESPGRAHRPYVEPWLKHTT